MSNRAVRHWTDLLQHLSSLISTASAEASVRVAQLRALDSILDEVGVTQGLPRAAYKKLIKDAQVPRRLLQLLRQAVDSDDFWNTQSAVAACSVFWAVVLIPATVVTRPGQDSLSLSCAQQFEEAGLQLLLQQLLERAMQLMQSQPQAAPCSASGPTINVAAGPAAAAASTSAAGTTISTAAASAAAATPAAAAAATASVAASPAPVSSRFLMQHVEMLLRFCNSLFSWHYEQGARYPIAPPLLPLAQLTLATRQYVSKHLHQQTLAATAAVPAAAASPAEACRCLWKVSSAALLLVCGALANSSGGDHPRDVTQPPVFTQSPCFLQCLFHLLVDHTFTAFLPPAHSHSSSHSQCSSGNCSSAGLQVWELDASSSWQVACSAAADVPPACTQLLTLLGLTPEAVLWATFHTSYGCPALAIQAAGAIPAAEALLWWQQLPPELLFVQFRLHQLLPCLLLHWAKQCKHWAKQCTAHADLRRIVLDAVVNVLLHIRDQMQDNHDKLAAVAAAQEQQQQQQPQQLPVPPAEQHQQQQQQQQQQDEDAPAQQVRSGIGSTSLLLPAGVAADMLRSLYSLQQELLLQLKQYLDGDISSSDNTGAAVGADSSLVSAEVLYEPLDDIIMVVLMLAADLDTQLSGGSLGPGGPAAAAAAAGQLTPTQAAVPVAVEAAVASAAAVDADLRRIRQAAAGCPKDAASQVQLIYRLLEAYVRSTAHNSALNMEVLEGDTHPIMHAQTYDIIGQITEGVNCKLQLQQDAPQAPQLVKGIHSQLLQRYGPSEAASLQLHGLLCSLVKLCLNQTLPYRRGILYAVAAATQEVLASMQHPALVDPAATGAADAAVVQTDQAPQAAEGASSQGTAQPATAAGGGDTARQTPADHLQQQPQQSHEPTATPAAVAVSAAAVTAAPALSPLPWLVLLGRCCWFLTKILIKERWAWLHYEGPEDDDQIIRDNGTTETAATSGQILEGAAAAAAPSPLSAMTQRQRRQQMLLRYAAGAARATAAAAAEEEEAGAAAESKVVSVSYQQSFVRAPLRRLIGSIQAHILADCPAWLRWEPLAAELAAAGGATATALQQQHRAAVNALEAAATGLRVSGDTAAVAGRVAEASAQLTAFAVSLMSIPTSYCCNDPGCVNSAGPSEQQLVGGRSCLCAGCRTARYCGKACQAQHWPSHKAVCRALRKATANAAAACPAVVATLSP